jgi:hypothetical protein
MTKTYTDYLAKLDALLVTFGGAIIVIVIVWRVLLLMGVIR